MSDSPWKQLGTKQLMDEDLATNLVVRQAAYPTRANEEVTTNFVRNNFQVTPACQSGHRLTNRWHFLQTVNKRPKKDGEKKAYDEGGAHRVCGVFGNTEQEVVNCDCETEWQLGITS